MDGRKYDPRRVRGYKYGGDTGRVGVGSHGMSPAGGGGQAGVTGDRSGGPGDDRERKLPPQTLSSIDAPAAAPPREALRQAADLQNYFSDLQRIALGGIEAQEALARFGIAPEQSYFQYRESFPEFGDLSGTSGGLAGIIQSLGKMSRTPESFAEGGRVGESMGRRDIQTDVGKFGQMLRDLMLMTGTSEGGSENPFGAPDKPRARRPIIPDGARPEIEVERLAPPVDNSPLNIIPGGLFPSQTGSPRYGGDAEAFRFEREFRDNSPTNIIPDGARPEIEVERLAPPVAPAESTPTEDFVQPYRDSEFNLSRRELIAFETLIREGLSGRAAMDRVKGMTPEQLDLMVEVANSSEGFKNGGETRRPFPGLLQENPQRTVTVEEAVRDRMESRGLTQEEAVKELQAIFRKTYPMSETVPDYSFAGGGQVRGRRDALPLVEGDHVVPAHAVKGNEGGLAALSKKLMGNKNYDGMIRGPGGPRDDAIKTRVYASGGGISGMMDNLQNPFNSVPARVSNKEYVIPRDAISNLGRMAGAPEGMANKAGQDIIYQLVENLKREA